MSNRTAPPTGMDLLSAKLHRPRTTAPLVPRPGLLAELTAGLERGVTLISAPAGYGKTTLVNQWLDSVDMPWAWLSLDERDSHLGAFLSYFLAAVRSVYPETCQISELMLRAPNLPSLDRLADALLNDLSALPGPLLLVLDDYHMIQSLDMHAMMSRLVLRMPNGFHLVLTTRADPPLPLERLRGRGQLSEIRGADLRFTADEAGQLLRLMLGPAVTDETAALLGESTEGWVVGLQLAAISLRGRSDPATFAQSIAQNSTQLVIDYLLAEVLQGLPEAQRTFLLQTSILERFCAPLFDAIQIEEKPQPAGEELLRAIRRANLFLVSLDDEGRWFRYHHLFRYLLRNRLSQSYTADEIRALHARAGAWFAARGLHEEAIAHTLAAGDALQAAVLVEERVHPALDREEWRQVERRIGLLPVEVRSRARLQVAQAWLNYIRYRFGAIVELLDNAEAALTQQPAGDGTLQGEIATLRAAIAYNNNDIHEMLRWAEVGMRQLRPDMQYVMGLAIFFYISGLQATGRHAEAVTFAHEQLDRYGQFPTLALRILLALCNVYYEMVDVPALQRATTTFQHIARQANLGLSLAWSSYARGWLHYQHNELAAAEACFLDVAAIAPIAHGRAVLDGFTGLVLARLAQGRPDEALAAVAELREQLLERGMSALLPIAESLQQHALLRSDSMAMDRNYSAPATALSIEFWEQPVLTQVRILLVKNDPTSIAQAMALLAASRAKATARYSQRSLIEIEALQALAYITSGDEAAAMAPLRQAVALAAAGGALRVLVDCGPGLAAPLQKLADDGPAPAFVRQVLALFDTPSAAELVMPLTPTAGNSAGANSPVETLTNREMDILILLAQRLTDKEIANRLFLSLGTVKKHTSHIYGKLGVHSRRAASAEARRRGLL